jgi:hypothetical protein
MPTRYTPLHKSKSAATCRAESDLKTRLQHERLKFSPDALKDYCHRPPRLMDFFWLVRLLAASSRCRANYCFNPVGTARFAAFGARLRWSRLPLAPCGDRFLRCR